MAEKQLIYLICWGRGWRRGRPCLSWEWAVFTGKAEPEEKFCNHGRNSQALLSILIVWAFFFPPAWTLPTQSTDSYKNYNKR